MGDAEREALGSLLQDADIFDNFTMDKVSFGQVFRLREHIEDSKDNPQDFVEEMLGKRHLWGASESLFSQIRERGDFKGQATKGYVIDTHA